MLITCLVATSLIVHAVIPVFAQAGYKPSIPQISSVKLVDSSYDVPPSSTTTVDEYTGKETTTIKPGYHVNSMSIEVTIKNQPFTPYTGKPPYTGDDGIERKFDLYYQVEVKGHFGDNWKLFGDEHTVQSNSGYTIVTHYWIGDKNVVDAVGSQLDFRVSACIGFRYDSSPAIWFWDPVWRVSVIEQSECSSVKTITVSGDSQLSPPSQTTTFPPVNSEGNGQPQYPSQTQPSGSIFSNSLFTLVVGVILGGIVVAVVMAFLRRHIKMPTYTNDSTQTNTLDVRCRYARKCTALVLITCLVVSILMVFSVTPTTV